MICSTYRTIIDDVRTYVARIQKSVATMVSRRGAVDPAAITEYQHEVHGFAWVATYAEALSALLDWAEALDAEGAFGVLEQRLLDIGFHEYCAQMSGGIAMSPGETVRPADFGLSGEALAASPIFADAEQLRNARMEIAILIADGRFGDAGYGDETLALTAEQFRRFASDRIQQPAHRWHLDNDHIPMAVIEQLGELGVFGLTIPQEWGGSGLGKLAMCIASEELSRGYIGVGSLGTRAEIAGELIRIAGTPAQKEKWLARIANGVILPTAVFTEPNTGSDLASLRTRAENVVKPDGSTVWRIYGNKTWITHAARADIMTLRVRTDPSAPGYRGLSMLIAEKPRGDDADPFPVDGLTGSEIEVLGYRGMKEYELAFDGFEVPGENLLGGIEGQGFKQLMETFESARIQTAERAVGVAQNAMELGMRYACERTQFGKALFHFPRVADKIVWMAAETMIARQLTYRAARAKDDGKRCDIEAGMAKLLAARVAWTNADNALQIHGGNGFALEYPISRVLCDARILSIFEGAAEIQAQVIAKGLLAQAN